MKRLKNNKAKNTFMLQTYWNIWKRIAYEEQNGNEKANYSEYVIKKLFIKLSKEYDRGFSSTNLKMMRCLYNEFQIG